MTLNKYFCLILLLTSSLFACSDLTQNNSPNTTDTSRKVGIRNEDKNNSPTLDTTFKLDYFYSLPDTIDGCSESYCYDTTKSNRKNYIFIGNLQDLGIIKVAGETLYLTKDSLESIQLSDTKFKSVFRGHGWTITIITKALKNVDEVSTLTGTLEIICNGKKQLIKIRGESGC